jgi:hypothetical protein
VAAAVASTSRQVGQTLGVALAGAIAAGALQVGPSFVTSSGAVWRLLVGCGAAVVLLGALSTTPRAEASARRAAREAERGSAASDADGDAIAAAGLGGV